MPEVKMMEAAPVSSMNGGETHNHNNINSKSKNDKKNIRNNSHNNNNKEHHHDHNEASEFNDSFCSKIDNLSFTSSDDTTVFNKVCRFVNQLRLLTGYVVNSSQVQFGIVILIGINAIMMGIGTFDFVQDDPHINDMFELVDQIFLIIFTIELACQFAYHGYRLFLDGWLIFDFVIIIVSWSFSQVQIIRAFRIFRALRLVTRIKVMKNLIVALFSVMPRMAAIGLLLFLIFYIFAVMFTQLFKDLYHDGHTEDDYFSRLDSTFLTQFQFMTLDNWAVVTRQVTAVYSWGWAPIVAFVVITGFIVVNLIIAVICDAVAALSEDDRNRMAGFVDDDESDNNDIIVDDLSSSSSSSTSLSVSALRNNKTGGSNNNHGVTHSTSASRNASTSTSSSSVEVARIRKQLDTLQSQVDHINKMQESTLTILQQLTQNVE